MTRYWISSIPELPSVAVSVNPDVVDHPVGMAVVSAGTVRSTLKSWERQSDSLPLASLTIVSSVWVPSVSNLIVVLAAETLCTGRPSTRQRSRATPEPLSVPAIVTSIAFGCQSGEAVVVMSTGSMVSCVYMSTLTVSSRQADALPASSITRVSSLFSVPWVVMLMLVPDGPDWIGPPLMRHSTRSTPDGLSVPLMVTG